MWTDASDFAAAGVLLRQGDGESWHPVAYAGRKLAGAERNYTAAVRERDSSSNICLEMLAHLFV